MKRFFLFTVFYLQILNLFSIEISNEQTWYYYSNYIGGNTVYEDRLYLNCLTGIEVYDIEADGSIELVYTKFFDKLIQNFKIDCSTGLIYLEFSSCSEPEFYHGVYEITENDIVQKYSPTISPNTGSYAIHLLEEATLFMHNYDWIYIDGVNENYHMLYDTYELILGCYDNKIVDRNFLDNNTFDVRFWRYDDIAEPELIYSYNSPNVSGYDFVHKLDNNHLLINIENSLSVLDISDENNYHFVSDYNLGFSSIIDVQLIGNSTIYLVNGDGVNCCLDYSDIYNPVILNQWNDEYQSCADFSIYNEQFIYKSKNGSGITICDISDLDNLEPETHIDNNTFANSYYSNGYAYYAKNQFIYKANVITTEEEQICATPITVGFFYQYQNLLVYYGSTETNSQLMIISLEDNTVLSIQPLNFNLEYCYQDKILMQNGSNIEVFQFNTVGDLNQIYTIDICVDGMHDIVTDYDENNFYVSNQSGEMLIDKDTFRINHNFGNYFSGNPAFNTFFFNYEEKLIVRNSDFNLNNYIYSLYDISDYDNPILLDQYDSNEFFNFSFYDDIIIRYKNNGNLTFYDKYENSFTELFYETTINALGGEIEIEEENNRLIFSSWYYLKTYDFNGETGINFEEIQSIPHNLTNFPNPFNPTTQISFSLPNDTVEASIEIYNIKGQEIKSIECDNISSGKHNVNWNGKNKNNQAVCSGVYLYKLIINNRIVSSSKMMLIK